MALSSESIAAIRKLLSQQSRREIKQLLLEAGAKADRILSIPVLSDIKSRDYLTTEDILSKGFDTIYADHEKDRADGILINLLRQLSKKGVDISYLKDVLQSDGVNLSSFHIPAKADKEQAIKQVVNRQTLNECIANKEAYEYDVFICHASEDKDSFVRPLANEFHRRGVNVWYDEFSLKVGDSLRRSIDQGLTESCYGISCTEP